jgi:hypothetical protein
LLDPWYEGGANRIALATAQKNYAASSVSEAKFKPHVKGVRRGDLRDPLWRPVDELDRAKVTTPAQLANENPNGPWKWYYWKK